MILEYKNIRINYTITGSGPTILLLHGFLENIYMWKDFVTMLSNRHRVICVDLLGHGQTDCLGYLHTMENMADAVIAVLNHHNVDKFKCIGHSMGGYVALAFAEKEPNRFESLCLMNSTFEADDEERKLLRTRAIKMATNNYENLVRMSFSNLFAPESKTKFETAYNEALNHALNTSVQGYIAAQEGMKLRPNRIEIFKALDGKKLIITGKKDGLVNPKAIVQNIKSTSILYEELSEGHMSHIENKSELSYIINHFIEK